MFDFRLLQQNLPLPDILLHACLCRSPGLATSEREEKAIELHTAATQVVEGTALKVAEFPIKTLLNNFLLKSVGDTSRLDADAERSLIDTAG